jgi:hypothetical protein
MFYSGKIKFALPAIISVFLISFLLVINACTDKDKIENGTQATESEVTVKTQEEASSDVTEETICTDSSPQTTVASDSGSSQSGAGENIIKFKGGEVNGNPAVLILEVNTDTQDITGVIQMGFQGFDMDMDSTRICDYVLNGSISGKLDPKTLGISGLLEGMVTTETEVEGCNDYAVSYEMIANMTGDYSKIRGYFETKTMDDYEFFLKKITE